MLRFAVTLLLERYAVQRVSARYAIQQVSARYAIQQVSARYVGIGFANTFYGWHISDLVIYDKPKELSKFYKTCGTQDCDGCQFWFNNGEYAACEIRSNRQLHRSPQSWCYVEK